MRNYLILLGLLLSLSACGPASYLADLAIRNGERILRPKITCKVPRYNISFDTNNLDIKERYQLAAKETGCFRQNSNTDVDYTLTPFVVKILQNQILETRLYRDKSIVDIHAYQYNQLNLQDKINESMQDVLSEILKKERHYAKNH